MTPMTKDQFFAKRTAWRTAYANLTWSIRDAKSNRREFIRTYAADGVDDKGRKIRRLISKSPNPNYSVWAGSKADSLREEARTMLEERAALKDAAREHYAAQKKEREAA